MEPLIKATNVNVTYQYGETKFQACKNGTIDVYEGEFIVIFGPSGSGKSTLLYAISGLETVDSGDIVVKDVNITNADPKELVEIMQNEYGFVFQSYNLISRLTCLENVILPGALAGRKSEEIAKKAEELLKRFGIWEHRNKYPSNLSGGQQQRVAISRSLINSPSILLADEPVGNLDSSNAKLVMEIMTELNKEGITLLLVSHDPSYIKYAHRTAYIRDGEVVRIQANSHRKQIKPPTKDDAGRSRMELLMDSYPELVVYGFPHMEPIIKAKMVAQYLMNPLESKQMVELERVIEQNIEGKLQGAKFVEKLVNPQGPGLSKKAAVKFAKDVSEIMAEGELAAKQGESDSIQKAERLANRLRTILKEEFSFRLSPAQQKSLDIGLELRLASQIKKDELSDFLSRSQKKGGVGLSKNSARDIAREVELAILVGYKEEN